MNVLYAIILGILQGLTEFLPVSSSGHLVIAQSLLPNFSQPAVLFDTILHAGTTLAIILYFRKKILALNATYICLLIIATFPAALVGLFLKAKIEPLFLNAKVVGFTLLMTSALNFLTDKSITNKSKMSWLDSLLVGVAQAIAIVPGISRSGATIFAGTRLGVKRAHIAEFSFLLSIPAVLGANFVEITSHGFKNNIRFDIYAVGFIAAFISGFLAISLVIKLLTQKRFIYFSVYCLVLGILVILL